MWVKFTPEYFAGILTGIGLGLFGIFLLAQFDPVSVTGLMRPAVGLVGICLLMAGGFWKLRLQGRLPA